MKLITFPLAPNGKRVEMFIAEKGEIDIEIEYVAMGPESKPRIDPLNALGQVPILEVETGKGLSESTSICQYIEELYPTPNLLGNTAWERGVTDMWQRRIELGLFLPILDYGHHTHPFFKEMLEQVPELGPYSQTRAQKTIDTLAAALGQRDYIALDRFTIADITAYCAVQMNKLFQMTDFQQPAIRNWIARIDDRPSAVRAQYDITPE